MQRVNGFTTSKSPPESAILPLEALNTEKKVEYNPYVRRMGWGGFEPRGLASLVLWAQTAETIRSSRPFVAGWVGADLNRRLPPCEGGIITGLDHRPTLLWLSFDRT